MIYQKDHHKLPLKHTPPEPTHTTPDGEVESKKFGLVSSDMQSWQEFFRLVSFHPFQKK
jgi:hypothetical protein